MKPFFKTIFFDLDGTISDSCLGIEKGVLYCLERSGIPDVPQGRIKNLIGIPIAEILRHLMVGEDTTRIKNAVAHFRDYYDHTGVFESVVYPGISEVLEGAATYAELYIITAKPTAQAIQLLKYHGLDHCFTGICGWSPGSKAFNKRDLIVPQLGKGRAVMVGDKKEDIDAGRSASIETAAVLYGYGSRAELTAAEPDYLLKNIGELQDLLLHEVAV